MVDHTEFSLTLIDYPYVVSYVRSVHISVQNALEQEPLELIVISSVLSKPSQIESIALCSSVHLPWGTLDSRFRTA